MTPRYIPGIGPSNPQLVICGEAGGFYEDRDGIPFNGPTGQLVNEFLGAHGLSREDVWLTNVVKYQPPRNKLKRLGEIGINLAQCKTGVLNEVQSLNPNAVLMVGNISLEAFTGKSGISRYRGSILPTHLPGIKGVASYHPANLFPKGDSNTGPLPWKWRKIMELDFGRAIQESRTRGIDIKEPKITIARCAADVYNYIERHKDRARFPYVASDIESLKSYPTCIGIAFTPDEGLVIPLMNPSFYRTIYRIDHVQLALMLQTVMALLSDPTIKLIGCNWKYDQERLWRMLKFLTNMPYADIALMHHCLYAEFPKKLEHLTSVFTRHPFYKDELGEGNKEHDFDKVMMYNGKDICYTMEIFYALLEELREVGQESFCFDFLMKLHPVYFEMEQVGFCIDGKKREELWFKYSALEAQMERDFRNLCGGVMTPNVRSPKQLRALLYGPDSLCKFKEPYRRDAEDTDASTDERTLTQLMANARGELQERIPWMILKLRQVKKVKSDYLAVPPDPDGRMRTTWQIAGTETLRSATGVLDVPMRPYKTGLSFSTIVKHSEYGKDVREFLIPPPGYVIGNADLSQAEPRIVAHLARDHAILEKMNSGKIDVHKEMAGLCLSINAEEAQAMGKEDPKRFVGKTVRNAMNYDAGGGELSMTINTDSKKYGIDIARVSRWQCDKFLTTAHNAHPNIRGIFHKEIQDCVHGENGHEQRVLLDPYGGRRMFFNRMGRELYKEAYAHIPQKVVRLTVARAMLALRGRVIFVNESHDAVTFFEKPDRFEETSLLIKTAFEQPIDFSRCSLPRGELVIPCEVEYGWNYGELRKYKFGEKLAA